MATKAIRKPASLVLQRDRHLKWKSFDVLELILMVLCGVLLTGFVITVFCDVVTRTIGRPWLWLQEVTSIQFIYCVFIGTAVAVRRNDHLLLTAITEAMHGRLRFTFETMNRTVILFVGVAMVWYGILNVQTGWGSFRMPSLTPIAYWYMAIPLSGALIVLFVTEQLINGWKNGYEHAQPPADADDDVQEDLLIPGLAREDEARSGADDSSNEAARAAADDGAAKDAGKGAGNGASSPGGTSPSMPPNSGSEGARR